MSNRVYNTDKVEDKIGLPGVIKYDKIDVFVDKNNKNNVWGIVYYTEYYKNKPVVKEKIVEFIDFNDMIRFIKTNFDGYEMSQRVDYSSRHIFFHTVDYINIDYYLHDGKPELNYIELNYKVYINGGYQSKKKHFSKEYEKMLLHIVKVNKKLVENTTTDSVVVNTIDVYAKKLKEHRTRKERMDKPSIGSIVRVGDNKRRKQERAIKNSKRVKNLKIFVSTVALGTILVSSGYKIVKDASTYKREFFVQHNPAITVRDIDIYLNKDRVNEIIENLMDGKYENVDSDNLKYAFDFIKKVENSNYDNNNSTSLFSYIEYFSNKIFENNQDIKWAINSESILGKIERLYNNCFKIIDNKLSINKEGLNHYVDYVASLTFMYDTTVDMRGSNQVPMYTQSIASIYATKDEIESYNKFPLILKYIILNQLKVVLQHVDYHVSYKPSNYFKDLDKINLINEVARKIELVSNSLKTSCEKKSK